MRILFFPFIVLGKLVEFIMKMTGRLLAIILGCLLVIAGVILSITVIGAIIGIPLVIVGVIMIVRGLF